MTGRPMVTLDYLDITSVKASVPAGVPLTEHSSYQDHPCEAPMHVGSVPDRTKSEDVMKVSAVGPGCVSTVTAACLASRFGRPRGFIRR